MKQEIFDLIFLNLFIWSSFMQIFGVRKLRLFVESSHIFTYVSEGSKAFLLFCNQRGVGKKKI